MDTNDFLLQGAEGAPKIGETLERRRVEKGLSFKEVEEATKIRSRYLQGLESEDYASLPDAVYVRGFLKTYANFLGLDGEALANDFREKRAPRQERRMAQQQSVGGYAGGRRSNRKSGSKGGGDDDGGFERPLVSAGGLAGTNRRRVSGATVATVAIALLVLAAVIGGLYLIGRTATGAGVPGGQPNEAREAASREPAGELEPAEEPEPAEPIAAPEEPPVEEPAPEAEEPTPEEPTPEEPPVAEAPAGPEPTEAEDKEPVPEEPAAVVPGEITATVRVTEEGPSWISVTTDGDLAYEQIAPVGFEQTFRAGEVFGITTGNAGGVEVEVNGQSVGTLGGYGEVVRREFPLIQPVE